MIAQAMSLALGDLAEWMLGDADPAADSGNPVNDC
jgi:hypothetical protein